MTKKVQSRPITTAGTVLTGADIGSASCQSTNKMCVDSCAPFDVFLQNIRRYILQHVAPTALGTSLLVCRAWRDDVCNAAFTRLYEERWGNIGVHLRLAKFEAMRDKSRRKALDSMTWRQKHCLRHHRFKAATHIPVRIDNWQQALAKGAHECREDPSPRS